MDMMNELGNLTGTLNSTFGIVALVVVGIFLILIILFSLWKLFHYIKDYPIKATFWTVRSNGLVPIPDNVGIFLDKKEGKKYAKSRKLKLEMRSIPFDKVESDASAWGRVNILRKSNDEMTLITTPELMALIERGELAPVIKDEVRLFHAQGIRRDFELLVKGTWWEKNALLITLATIAIILFLTMIALGFLFDKAMAFGGQIQGATDNFKAGAMANERESEINLLLYSLDHKVTIAPTVNYTNLFQQINITEIDFNKMVIR